MKQIFISVLAMLFPLYLMSCDCSFFPFCSHLESDTEYAVLMIETNNEGNYYLDEYHDKYFDVRIIDQLFGFPIGVDSLTYIDYGTSCDVPIDFFSDTIIIKFPKIEIIENANYPIFSIFTCLHNTLVFEKDTVRGNISKVDPNTPWDSSEKMSFKDFMQFYEFECSLFARNPDLDELRGVEVLENPVFNSIMLKNNLDKDIDFSIFNVNGQFISKGKIESNSILEKEVYELTSGVYFVRIEDGIGPKFHKILKI